MLKNNFNNCIIISSILLFGCASNQSITIKDIDIEIPDKWQTSIPDYEPLTGDWWDLFNDPGLEKFVEEIMRNSPDLKTIVNNRKMAYQNAKINGSGIFPTLNPSINSSKSQQNLSGFGFGEFFSNINGGQDSSGAQSNDEVITFDSESFGLSLNLQWEIDVWGRALNGRRASFKDYESLDYELSYLAFSTIIRSAQTYFQAVEASEQLKIAQESYTSLERIRDLVQDRFKRGIKSSLDFRLAETSVSTAKIAIEDRKNQLHSLNRGLEIISGKYPAGILVSNHELPDTIPQISTGIPAEIITRRPDIKALILKVEASGLNLSQAKRNLLPGIMLNGSIGTSATELKDILNEDNKVWSLGAGITSPLFNGGRLRSAVKIQESVVENSKQELIQGLLLAFSEIETILYLEQSIEVKLDAISNAASQSKSAYLLSTERYDKGVTTLESVLNSQRQYNDIRSRYLTLKRQRIENRLSLLLAIGGSYES
jgi:NodT family efflux transporter outer membrane factor (OMF) lipoprotein